MKTFSLVSLLIIFASASASADQTYRPAYDQADAQQAAVQWQAQSAGFSCMTCAATLQIDKAAGLARWLADCSKIVEPTKMAKCQAFGQTFFQ